MKPGLLVFRAITLRAFRSFREERVFEFGDLPGLFLLRGKNKSNPELGANGVGKSTLWDALTWCLYGWTSRGLRAGDVESWGDQKEVTRVQVDLSIGKLDYSITRTHDPNAITLRVGEASPKVVDQRVIDELVGFSYDEFLNTILMGQFGRYFFDLSRAEKLQRFSEILGLDQWLVRSNRARDQIQAVEGALSDAKDRVSRLQGRAEELRKQLKEAAKEGKRFEEARGVKLLFLRNKIESSTNLLTMLRERKHKVLKAMTSAGDSDEAIERRIFKVDNQVRKLDRKIAGLRVEVQGAERDVSDLRRKRDRILSMKGKCPACDQKIPEDHRERCATLIGREITWAKGELARLREALNTASEERREARDWIGSLSRRLNQSKGKGQAEKRRLGEIRREESSLLRDMEGVKLKIQETKLLRNPYGREEIRKVLAQVERKLLKAGKARKADGDKLVRLRYWSGAFKEIRLWIIREALSELEIAVNNSLMELGLAGWKVTFDIERENKSGGVTKGFEVFIHTPDATGGTPWDAWSGGETQRLRIAGAIGLARVISARKGVASNVEIWDEPTAHLSEEGINDLIDFFEGRAREEGRQIWLVDHRAIHHGAFDGQVTIVKDDRGSRIIQ